MPTQGLELANVVFTTMLFSSIATCLPTYTDVQAKNSLHIHSARVPRLGNVSLTIIHVFLQIRHILVSLLKNVWLK
jgi:hypothetical protein